MGAVATAAGNIFSGLSDQGAANAQKNIARSNAELAERNAGLTMAAGEGQSDQIGLRNRATAGSIKAHQAASGVDVGSGSAKEVQTSQRALGLYDAMTAKSNAARAAFGYKIQAKSFRDEAAIDKAKANAAMWGAGLNAFSSLVGGASSAMSQYQQWQQATGSGAEAAGAAGDAAGGAMALAF